MVQIDTSRGLRQQIFLQYFSFKIRIGMERMEPSTKQYSCATLMDCIAAQGRLGYAWLKKKVVGRVQQKNKVCSKSLTECNHVISISSRCTRCTDSKFHQLKQELHIRTYIQTPVQTVKYILSKNYDTYAVKQVPFLDPPSQTSFGNRTTWKIGKTAKRMIRNHRKNLNDSRYPFPIFDYLFLHQQHVRVQQQQK